MNLAASNTLNDLCNLGLDFAAIIRSQPAYTVGLRAFHFDTVDFSHVSAGLPLFLLHCHWSFFNSL